MAGGTPCAFVYAFGKPEGGAECRVRQPDRQLLPRFG